MNYMEKKEPIRFNIRSEIYDETKKEMVPFNKMIINCTRLGIEWPEAYTLLVFERDSYPGVTFVKLIKILEKQVEMLIIEYTCMKVKT